MAPSYLELVVDPTSFTKTIENMFYFAFLVKEGKVELQEEKIGSQNDKRITARIAEAPRQESVPTKQSVLKLNYEMYKQLCERLKREQMLVDQIQVQETADELEEEEEREPVRKKARLAI
jgi:hypothetical protein